MPDRNDDINQLDLWQEKTEKELFKITEVSVFTSDRLKEVLEKALKNKWIDKKDLLKEMSRLSREKEYLDLEIKNDVSEILWDWWLESIIEQEVIDYFKGAPKLITSGSEWEIYTMNIPWKWEVVVIKKIYESLSENNIEFDNHYKFKELEKALTIKWDNNIVKIPTPIHHFYDGKSEYIVMEHIPWKSLYTMILEKMVEEDVLKYLKHLKREEDKKDFLFMIYLYIEWEMSLQEFKNLSYSEILDLITDEDWYIKRVSFSNDTIAESGIIDLYSMLYEFGVISEQPSKSEIDESWNWVNPFLDKKLKDITWWKGLWVFAEKTRYRLIKWVEHFIENMHKNWLYHRDLWWNPRNIMFVEKRRNFYTPYIIDFWKAVDTWVDNWWDPYDDQLNWWRYINDENIIIFMNNLSSWEKIKIIDRERDNILDKLYSIWEKIRNEFAYSFNFDTYINESQLIALSSKNTVYYNSLISILKTGYVRWYKLNLWKNWDIKDNSIVLSEILVLMFYVKDENFYKIPDFIENLKWNKDFKVTWKNKAIPLYKEIYEEVKKIRGI